jgi:DNA-binding SARP family transcriptional activator
MVTLRIYLLGPFKLEASGVPVTGFATQKAELLLAYLVATAPKAHSRESLATRFWPRSAPGAARYNLRYALWSVRNALRNAGLSPERYLKTDPETCQFAPATDCWRDTGAFAEKSAIAETSEVSRDLGRLTREITVHLQDAVALYRGEFLEGVQVPGCPLLQEWLTFERERWRHRYLEALDRLVQVLVASRDYDQAVAHSRGILRLDPLRESAHRRLMQLYWLTGRRTMALRQYETCRHLLQEKLSIEPLTATRDLYHRIRNEESPPVLPGPPIGALPVPLPGSPLCRFVGREPELTLLRNCFAEAPSGRGRLVLMAGEAGVGKTRLLQEFARRVGNRAGLICWGNCFPGEQGLPYQPLIEALRSAVRQLDPAKLKGLPAIWLHEVSRLVPELAERIPSLPPVPPLPPAQEKNRLYEGVAQFLLHAAAQSPISNLPGQPSMGR